MQYAFENAQPGDLFIRKAPASTIEDLAKAVALVMGVEPQIQIIGTRHGRSFYESLLSREEMAEAEDCGEYYRVPLDARSLDYGMFVEEGGHQVEHKHDYTSHNTNQLSVEEVAELLTDLPEMRRSCEGVGVTGPRIAVTGPDGFSSLACAARRGPAGVATWWASGRRSSTTLRGWTLRWVSQMW